MKSLISVAFVKTHESDTIIAYIYSTPPYELDLHLLLFIFFFSTLLLEIKVLLFDNAILNVTF